jgi:hypothetical protein
VSAFSNDANYITSAAIPTDVSAFSNDANYITSAAIPTDVSVFSNDANYITSAVANVISVNGATGIVSLEIPTATSDLSNDSGFITANVVGNLSATGNITGVYIKGNGSELTNLPAPAVAQDITSTGDMSIMTYDGNLKYVNNATVEPSTGNIKTAGNISALGNITGNYILGNGSQLTGLPATYGNANVATFMAGFGSNGISTTGNINAGNVSVGGTLATTGNTSVGGALAVTGNTSVAGNLSLTGSFQGVEPAYTFADDSASASWYLLGTWNTVQTGQTLYMRIVSHTGYNGVAAQNQVTELMWAASNGTATYNGSTGAPMYGAGQASVNSRLGTGNSTYQSPSVFRMVQVSSTQYQVYGYFAAYTRGSTYSVQTSNLCTWTHSGTVVSTPGGNYLEFTPTSF